MFYRAKQNTNKLTLLNQKGNFQPDRVTSVAASVPNNNVHAYKQISYTV